MLRGMKQSHLSFICGVLLLVVGGAIGAAEIKQPGVVTSEFIYDKAPHEQCHASTIEQTPTGLVAAWFGGTREGRPDVGIWVSRQEDGRWTPPVEVANGVQDDGTRHPCWNPVLFQPTGKPLMLFYKVGPKPSSWWGMVMTSSDGGRTWSEPRRLPDPILGPVKNKPVMLGDAMICPTSGEATGWEVFIDRTTDLGKTWTRIGPINDGEALPAIQPTVLVHGPQTLQILCRTKGPGKISESWSRDGGKTWSEMKIIDLPNPNSGIDAVTLADGRHLLVYNHTGMIEGKWGGARSPLNVAVSPDGKAWSAAVVLESEPGEYSYPAVIQTRDGLVHITYTWKRQRVKHVVLDPAKLELRPIAGDQWPK